MVMILAAALLDVADCRAEEGSAGSDEYEVMSTLVREWYGTEFSLVVIRGETEPWCLNSSLGFLRRLWPELESETVDSLITVNSGATLSLAGRFRLPVEYRLVPEEDYLRALRWRAGGSPGATLEAGNGPASGTAAFEAAGGGRGPDWDNFDREYPDAQGYLTFSRVGFNSGRTQALVIFSNAYRCSGTRTRPRTREIAFFIRKGGDWELVGVSRGVKAMY